MDNSVKDCTLKKVEVRQFWKKVEDLKEKPLNFQLKNRIISILKHSCFSIQKLIILNLRNKEEENNRIIFD